MREILHIVSILSFSMITPSQSGCGNGCVPAYSFPVSTSREGFVFEVTYFLCMGPLCLHAVRFPLPLPLLFLLCFSFFFFFYGEEGCGGELWSVWEKKI